ncbi:hypothetical protein AB0D12_38605 [Streptomyces sp. NPDC048479]|uniref:hypothetical protein n=1 Tax=Streptomyces sp. NPDC048479 TaxID=3154725 RepID=UPI0034120688
MARFGLTSGPRTVTHRGDVTEVEPEPRLRDLTQSGNYAYYVDLAHFMAGLALDVPSEARWLDGEQLTRSRWRALVTARSEYLRTAR